MQCLTSLYSRRWFCASPGSVRGRIREFRDGHKATYHRQNVLFLWRKTAVEERAKQIARMVMLIVHSLQTKSYDDFVESFSNPDSEPDSVERLNRQLRFQMRISSTCWYEATAVYPPGGTPYFLIEGGGDDWGVSLVEMR